MNVTVEIEKETFFANGKVCIKRGYLDVLKPLKEKNIEENSENENKEENANLDNLATLKKGQKIEINNFESKEAETSPPNRYNSGSMILAMEKAVKLIEDEELREQIKGAGIGTSATRAEIIKK